MDYGDHIAAAIHSRTITVDDSTDARETVKGSALKSGGFRVGERFHVSIIFPGKNNYKRKETQNHVFPEEKAKLLTLERKHPDDIGKFRGK